MKLLVSCASIAVLTAATHGALVQVDIYGEVEFNQAGGPFAQAMPGDDAIISFQVDSNVFLNGSFPTRGYVIDQDSFTFTLGPTTIGLQSPFPAGTTPYFTIRDNDPAVDGFFLADSTDFPTGVPTDQTGIFGQFISSFSVTYGGDLLPSLDIPIKALGEVSWIEAFQKGSERCALGLRFKEISKPHQDEILKYIIKAQISK